MIESLWKNQPVCCCTYLFPLCSVGYMRYKLLHKDMSKYKCCQGYMDNRCFHSGELGEKSCPMFCLCMEVSCCLGPSMSSTRMSIIDQFQLRPDPCDNRIIRFTNCLMCFSCLCEILSIFYPDLKEFTRVIHAVSNCIVYMTIGCMASQVHNEINYRFENHDSDEYHMLNDERKEYAHIIHTTHYAASEIIYDLNNIPDDNSYVHNKTNDSGNSNYLVHNL